MLGLLQFEGGLCVCGWHESLTHDRSNHFTFDDRVCPVCAGAERYARVQAEREDEWRKRAGDDLPGARQRPGDGRRTFTRLMSPDEVAERSKPRR